MNSKFANVIRMTNDVCWACRTGKKHQTSLIEWEENLFSFFFEQIKLPYRSTKESIKLKKYDFVACLEKCQYDKVHVII